MFLKPIKREELVLFFLLHTLFRMNFRKFINKKQPKVSLIFFLSVKFPIRKKDIIK